MAMVLLSVMGNGKKILTPTSMILLGATGDLAKKKLLPSLMRLYEKGMFPEHFYLLVLTRSQLTHDEYRSFAREHIKSCGKKHDPTVLESFLSCIECTQGAFEDTASFERIKGALEKHDAQIGMCSSKLFYLAVPPTFYDTIFEQLALVQLEQPCVIGDGWTRILVEKPFGSDLLSAQKLEEKLCALFKEEQIYRIDHYLAKAALQNILTFRFSNVLFEGRWNKKYVEGVYIQMFEEIDVSDRGAFFDNVGALRDVGQNHILQMIALIALLHPKNLEAKTIRKARARILKALRMPVKKDLRNSVVKGQYDGYRGTRNVLSTSETETYFALKTFVETPEWSGVPFYIEHGKALSESKVSISVRFRPSKNCVCKQNGSTREHVHPNFITFSISHEEKIELLFWVRKQGVKYELEQKRLVFDRHAGRGDSASLVAEAYEEVLFDALSGDQTLFVSSEEQEAAWHYITAILTLWKNVSPQPYTKGSDGPESKLKKEIRELLQVI